MRPHTYLLEDKVRKHSNCLGIIALGHVMETERAYTDKGTFRGAFGAYIEVFQYICGLLG